MRLLIVVFISALLLNSCKKQAKTPDTDTVVAKKDYVSFGKQIAPDNASIAKLMLPTYTSMKVGDTLTTKMLGTVTEVCQAKGCWMKLQLDADHEVMVRFKDYGFFVPKDIKDKQVIVNGLAFVEELSVEDQRHYAQDAGKSEEELAQITQPKRTYGFEADGVLLKP